MARQRAPAGRGASASGSGCAHGEARMPLSTHVPDGNALFGPRLCDRSPRGHLMVLTRRCGAGVCLAAATGTWSSLMRAAAGRTAKLWRARVGTSVVGRARARRAVPTLAVFVVGAQRSGTTMILDAFRRLPGVEVYGEADPRAFDRFRLRSPDVIRNLVHHSSSRAAVFKPLCPRAVWVYRAPDDRIRSFVARFGDANRRALRRIAQDRDLTGWEAGGLTEEQLALIRSFDYESLSAESASGLFWFLRNSLYFELELDRRPDVRLCSYGNFVAHPESSMRALCRFLDVEYRRGAIEHVHASPPGPPLDLDRRVRVLCDEMMQRLDAGCHAQASASGVPRRNGE